MTTDQIHKLFDEKIQIKGIHKILEVDKFAISNYRRRKDELSLGLKLELLLKMGEIVVFQLSEPESESVSSKNARLANIAYYKMLENIGKAGKEAELSGAKFKEFLVEHHRDGGSSIQDFKNGKVVDAAYNINGYVPKSEVEYSGWRHVLSFNAGKLENIEWIKNEKFQDRTKTMSEVFDPERIYESLINVTKIAIYGNSKVKLDEENVVFEEHETCPLAIKLYYKEEHIGNVVKTLTPHSYSLLFIPISQLTNEPTSKP